MVWDEGNVNTEINTLNTKIIAKMNDQQSAINIRQQFLLIQQRYEQDGVTPITIIDKGTGEAMTTARKDEVYDKCKVLADLVT